MQLFGRPETEMATRFNYPGAFGASQAYARHAREKIEDVLGDRAVARRPEIAAKLRDAMRCLQEIAAIETNPKYFEERKS